MLRIQSNVVETVYITTMTGKRGNGAASAPIQKRMGC